MGAGVLFRRCGEPAAAVAVSCLFFATISKTNNACADAWISAAPLTHGDSRQLNEGHALSALHDGRVLLSGGETPTDKPMREVQVWDPRTSRWEPVASMGTPRTKHTALTLRNGEVLVVGGWVNQSQTVAANLVEIWSPKNNRWRRAGELVHRRVSPILLPLADGGVLAMGGERGIVRCATIPERWDPKRGSSTALAELPERCGSLAAAKLGEHRLLVTGGTRSTPQEHQESVADAHFFDLRANRWVNAPAMLRPRASHTAAAVGGGILVVGGHLAEIPAPYAAELFDPEQGSWRWVPCRQGANWQVQIVPLPKGDALVVPDTRKHLALRWDASKGELRAVTDLLMRPGNAPRAVRLPDDRVFLTAPPWRFPMIWDPQASVAGRWERRDPSPTLRFWSTVTPLSGDRVLVAGGEVGSGSDRGVLLGDLRRGRWRNVQPLQFARMNHTATALPDGDVLVVGGFDAQAMEPSKRRWFWTRSKPRYSRAFPALAERWNAERGWSPAGELGVPRNQHGAALLSDGRVLVVGGSQLMFGPSEDGRRLELSRMPFTRTAEIWSPATNTWEATGSLIGRGRRNLTTTPLPDGRVLVAGGSGRTDIADPADAAAELWDPSTGRWKKAGSLSHHRFDHTASLLSDGRVLVVGGRQAGNGGVVLGSAEIFDPKALEWKPTGSLQIPRYGHHALLLEDGRVLVVGGSPEGNVVLEHGEVWDPKTGRWTLTPRLPDEAGGPIGLIPFPDKKAMVLAKGAVLVYTP